MLFSDVSMEFFLAATYHVNQHHPKQLGSFLRDAFEGALTPTTGLGYRQMQSLGRDLLLRETARLVQQEPEALSPLATLVRDPKTSSLARKKPMCCNSMVVKDGLAPAFLRAYLKRWPETVGAFLAYTFGRAEGEWPESYKLFRPMGRRLIGHVNLSDVKDTDAFQEAWMRVKSRSQGPLDLEPGPKTEPSPGTEAKPEPGNREDGPLRAKPSEPNNGIDIDKLWDESEDVTPEEEAPRGAGGRVDFVPEKVENYEGIICDENEPAFVVGMDHPTYGQLLVMVSLNGYNSEGQMVYRGGLIYRPDQQEDVTHRHLKSVFDPVAWEDDETRMLTKAVPWKQGLYGKYWTNVKQGTDTQWGDIESMKRYFILAKFPEVRFVGKETYDRHRRRVMRQLQAQAPLMP